MIAPRGKAVLASGDFYVICRGGQPDLAIDGIGRSWDPFADPLKVARLHLEPGQHEIRIGDRKIAVRVGGKGGADGWETYAMHPIAKRGNACGNCHQTSERRTAHGVSGQSEVAVEAPKPYTACLECHKPLEFEAVHSHPLEPLKHCGSCHHLHGSPVKGLLQAPVKKLCAGCHDS